jgi:hypothetical protein
MDKTREFWLRLGVIVGGVLILSSAMAAFSQQPVHGSPKALSGTR